MGLETESGIDKNSRKVKKSFKDDDPSGDGLKKHFQSFENDDGSDCFFEINGRRPCLNADCDSEPDRSDPQWKIIYPEKIQDKTIDETVSDSVQTKISLWDEIIREYEDKRLEFDNLRELEKPYEAPLPTLSKLSAVQYLDKHIFSILCPALEDMLIKAREWNCLMIQKCRFNGLDYIAELLWNRNPLHPSRQLNPREIFDIPYVVIWLYYNPRPIYPLSWLWSKEEAIVVLQSYIRRYLICRETDCSEMRQFWKAIKEEKDETKRQNRIRIIFETEKMFNEVLDQIVANAVYEAEWKIYGCKCISEPCNCVCKCMMWCKCCKCYKVPLREK